MSSDFPDDQWSLPYECHDCGGEIGFRSRPRNLLERFVLPLLLLQPVRCGDCFRRDYRLIFTKVRPRLSDIPKMMPGKETATSKRNVA
jgi:hypothetical protein